MSNKIGLGMNGAYRVDSDRNRVGLKGAQFRFILVNSSLDQIYISDSLTRWCLIRLVKFLKS